MPSKLDLRLGIDVGGTHTDAVVLDRDNSVVAKTKQPTSVDVTAGIHAAYTTGVDERGQVEGVRQVAAGLDGEGENQCRAALFVTMKTSTTIQRSTLCST